MDEDNRPPDVENTPNKPVKFFFPGAGVCYGRGETFIDNFNVDTGPSSSLLIVPQGSNLIVTDGVHTATFLNFSIAQFGNGTTANGPFIVNTFDGSLIVNVCRGSTK